MSYGVGSNAGQKRKKEREREKAREKALQNSFTCNVRFEQISKMSVGGATTGTMARGILGARATNGYLPVRTIAILSSMLFENLVEANGCYPD